MSSRVLSLASRTRLTARHGAGLARRLSAGGLVHEASRREIALGNASGIV
jgi:hypothetical protein